MNKNSKALSFDARPNVERFVMPTKYTEESFLEGPVGSVVIQYELVVLHILRQLPERHQSAPFRFHTIPSSMISLLVLPGFMQVRCLIHCLFGFPVENSSPFTETHCLCRQPPQMEVVSKSLLWDGI
jgi:hypothetical protein